MKVFRQLSLGFLISFLLSGCAILKEPEIVKRGDIQDYKYVVLPGAASLTSSSGGIYGNEYGIYGSSSSKQLNPRSIIEGILLKKGLLSVESVTEEKRNRTLIVKYGESGRRDVAGGLGGYTLEVTIAIITANTDGLIYSCVAEGQGSTEVDDIRDAIHRCLSEI